MRRGSGKTSGERNWWGSGPSCEQNGAEILANRRYFLKALGGGISSIGVGSITRSQAYEKRSGRTIDLGALPSPIVFRGDSTHAFRDPAAIYHQGTFYLYFTLWKWDKDVAYSYTALSKSMDLVHWTEPRILTAKDLSLNYSSPGNVIRYKGKWVLCLQTYPTPNGEKYGNEDARIFIMRSDDLIHWDAPELLRVKGPGVPREEMGRMIDPYLVEDKDQPGKWWCVFDTNAANMSYSYDLKTWTYVGQVPAGENGCVLREKGRYWMIHSLKEGVGGMGMKVSDEMVHWEDRDVRITLGVDDWPWAQGRITAGFVMDMRGHKEIGKYLMFFHGEPEHHGFKRNASLGLAWSDDLYHWDWPKSA